MTIFKRFGKKDTEPSTSCILRGRVVIKETRQGLPDLIVQAFWVNLEDPRHSTWYSHVDDAKVVRSANSTATNTTGSFTMTVDKKHALGKQPVVTLVVRQPEDENGNQDIWYRSPVPRVVGKHETFLIRVSADRARAAGDVQVAPITRKEVLSLANERTKEVTDWLKSEQQKQAPKVKKSIEAAAKAFENFKPSMISESVRKRGNYLEKREDLASTLRQTHNKELKRLARNKVVKKRLLSLPKGLTAKLGLDEEEKEIVVDTSKVPEILKTEPFQESSAISHALQAAEQRKKRGRDIVDELFKHIVKEQE